jgi:4'-phosphopantetheinyl transferase EntD
MNEVGALRALLPSTVICVEASPRAWDAPLHPEERRTVEKAVAKRRREFAAVRSCARRALAGFGIEGFPLLIGPDRVPLWPRLVVGCITHCDGFCAAAVARRTEISGIGIDAETSTPIARELLPLVCSPLEIERLRDLPSGTDWPKLVFSAKESSISATTRWLGSGWTSSMWTSRSIRPPGGSPPG